jgi:2-polyprenyl-6-methoxyphenol hydroxylase-like FAD-dependent oxidoreductase
MSRLGEADVLIVGAGPVGLLTALAMARRGARVEVIDQRRRAATHSYGLALHPETLTLLDSVGVAAPLLVEDVTIDRAAFYEGETRHAELRLDELPGPYPFILGCPQDRLERALETALEASGVPVRWDHRLAAFHPEGERLRCEVERLEPTNTGYGYMSMEWVVSSRQNARVTFLVGADGYDSLIRRRLGIAYRASEPTCELELYEFECQACPPHEVRVVLDAESTNVLWPLPGNRMRWTFQRNPDEPVELTRQRLMALARRRAPWFTEEAGELVWTEIRMVEPRLAEHFGRDAVWLAGDAAHTRHPAGVQGMNVGIQEGGRLAERLCEQLRHRDAAALDAFDAECHAAWERLIAPRSFRGENDWVRRHLDRIPACVPATGASLDRLLEQIGLT